MRNIILEQVVDVRKQQIMEAIRGYLSRHPDAADSATGIAWWAASMGVEGSVPEVVDALDSLCELGFIERRELTGGQVIYRAKNPQRNAGNSNGQL